LPEPLGHVAGKQTLSACLASAHPSSEHGLVNLARRAPRCANRALVVVWLALVGCSAPAAEPVDTDPCARRVAIAAAAIDIDDQVDALDEAMTVCRDLDAFANEVDDHPGTLGVEPAVFAARRCARSELPGIATAPICDDPAVGLLTGAVTATAVDDGADALSFIGRNLNGDEVTIVADADTPFIDGRPEAIVVMVDTAFTDGCSGLDEEVSYWSALIDDPGIGPEASVYAQHALDLSNFIGCDRS
jgi:hypothetical protein